jgi:hypothetical protein
MNAMATNTPVIDLVLIFILLTLFRIAAVNAWRVPEPSPE